MGQASNSNRNASLDQKKRRAAGRINDRGPEQTAIEDAAKPVPAKGQTGGAFGKDGVAHRNRGTYSQGAGGVGGAQSRPKDAPINTPRAERPARKGGT